MSVVSESDTRKRVEACLWCLRQGQIMAARLRPTLANHTAWIGVYPLMPGLPETDSLLKRERISLPLPEGVQAYRIRLFEIADALRETNFAEPDMRNKRTFAVVGEEALVSKLTELEVSLAILRHPRDVDYPL